MLYIFATLLLLKLNNILLHYILLILEIFSYLIAFSVLIYINPTTLGKNFINRIVMHMRFTIKRVLKASQKTQI